MHRVENLSGTHDNGAAQIQIGLRDNAFIIKRNSDGTISFVDKETGAILPIKTTNTNSDTPEG